MIAKVHPLLVVRNVVASFSLTTPPHGLDLEKIHYAFKEESIWDEATFNYGVVVFRIKKPKMSFLIYRTGKVICTGAKNVRDAEQSADYLLSRLNRAGFNVEKKTEARVQNIVATTDLMERIDVEKFVDNIRNLSGVHVIYEPEQFPAPIIKLPVAKGSEATILLFSTGKLVCVGLKEYENVKAAVNFVISKLAELTAQRSDQNPDSKVH